MKKLFTGLVVALGLVCSPSFAQSKKEAKLVLDGTNAIVLRGEISGESVAKTSVAILESTSPEINLYISSPGGSVIAGLQLINILKSSGKKINCIASIAASMAFVILQACDNRYVTDSSIVMQHVATYGIAGQAPNNLSRVKFIHKMLKDMDEAQAKRIGLSLKEFRSKTRNDWWLFGKEAVEQNVADGIMAVSCTPELTKKRVTERFTVFIFRVKVVYSACPAIEEPLEVGLDDGKTKLESVAEQRAYVKFLEKVHIRNTMTTRYLGKLGSK